MDDTALKQLVEDELAWEASVDASDIKIVVDDGMVRLAGHVPTYAQKHSANAAVHRLSGVRGVICELEVGVQPKALSDQVIAERCEHVLDWAVGMPTEAIRVKVEDGVITLTGEVEWRYQRTAASEAVMRLGGVRGVTNLIQVRPHVSPADIQEGIAAALQRQAELEAKGIAVLVQDGTVRLEGRVRSLQERDLVEHAAWSAPGVKEVENHLMLGGLTAVTS